MKHPSSANLSTKTVNNIFFVLEDMKVKNISDQMNGKAGPIIHDGWIYDGINCLELFASYELKQLTMYYKLKLIANQFHPCVFLTIVMMIMSQKSR